MEGCDIQHFQGQEHMRALSLKWKIDWMPGQSQRERAESVMEDCWEGSCIDFTCPPTWLQWTAKKSFVCQWYVQDLKNCKCCDWWEEELPFYIWTWIPLCIYWNTPVREHDLFWNHLCSRFYSLSRSDSTKRKHSTTRRDVSIWHKPWFVLEMWMRETQKENGKLSGEGKLQKLICLTLLSNEMLKSEYISWVTVNYYLSSYV